MTSALAWIDYDEVERQRVQRILNFFKESDTLDELGLGAARDSISDLLFPGVSTLHRRLRYMLFVPWIMRGFEGRRENAEQLQMAAREQEFQLADALQAGGERLGVIGREVGRNLKLLPSTIYWSGLGVWGIRTFNGSISGYFETVVANARLQEDPDSPPPLLWNPDLPAAPDGLIEKADFKLFPDEAQYLRDRLAGSVPKSLLAWLAQRREHGECDHIWQHPSLADFPDDLRHLVRQAESFSDLMQGGALLYNLMLAELRESPRQDELLDEYGRRLSDWSGGLCVEDLATWSLEDFWRTIFHPDHIPHQRLKDFVRDWRGVVVATGGDVATSDLARNLVRNRERQLKKSASRFANRKALDNWSGASGVRRQGFRWAQARTYLKDLADAG